MTIEDFINRLDDGVTALEQIAAKILEPSRSEQALGPVVDTPRRETWMAKAAREFCDVLTNVNRRIMLEKLESLDSLQSDALYALRDELRKRRDAA